MEVAYPPPDRSHEEPRLLLELAGGGGWPRAWIGSVTLHLAAIAALMLAPSSVFTAHKVAASFRITTPLVAPPAELTQTAPNREKIGKEFTLENLLPRPRVRIPPGAVSTTRPAAPLAEVPRPQPAPLPEPPKLDAPERQLAQALPPVTSGKITAPPPQILAEEKPKLAFEKPTAVSALPKPEQRGMAPPRTITRPDASVEAATRAAARSGPTGLAVGDLDALGQGGMGPGLDLPPAMGKTATALELLSDPGGVDFKPYLIRILATVKRNWLVVIPESARMGRTGKVEIQFAIDRDGSVPKLVIASSSGTDALDRAAVAGISASNPFPPLPDEFHGNQVRLQFTFLYNVR
jgi:TonB family protein